MTTKHIASYTREYSHHLGGDDAAMVRERYSDVLDVVWECQSLCGRCD